MGVMLHDPHTNTDQAVCSNSVDPFMNKVMLDFKQFLHGGNVIPNIMEYSFILSVTFSTGCNVSFIYFQGDNQKASAEAAKTELLKKVQALYNRKYGMSVIHDLKSTLHQQIHLLLFLIHSQSRPARLSPKCEPPSFSLRIEINHSLTILHTVCRQ